MSLSRKQLKSTEMFTESLAVFQIQTATPVESGTAEANWTAWTATAFTSTAHPEPRSEDMRWLCMGDINLSQAKQNMEIFVSFFFF